MHRERFLPTRSAKVQHRDKENAFCIRNKPFLFFSGFFCTGNVFCPLAVQKYSIGTKKTLSASEINRFYSYRFLLHRERFCPLAVIYYIIGTKKTLSASEINRFYFLAVSFAQGTFLPTRSNLLQFRDKENDHIIKSFLLFVQREAFEVTFALSLLIKKGRTSVQPFWLGWPDSNQRMQQSKCCVLPLDDTPIFTFLKLYLNKRKSAREISCRFRKWGG